MNQDHPSDPSPPAPAPPPAPALLDYQPPQAQLEYSPRRQMVVMAILYTLVSVGQLFITWFILLAANLGMAAMIIIVVALGAAWIIAATLMRRRHPHSPDAQGLLIGAWLGCLLFGLINGGCLALIGLHF